MKTALLVIALGMAATSVLNSQTANLPVSNVQRVVCYQKNGTQYQFGTNYSIGRLDGSAPDQGTTNDKWRHRFEISTSSLPEAVRITKARMTINISPTRSDRTCSLYSFDSWTSGLDAQGVWNTFSGGSVLYSDIDYSYSTRVIEDGDFLDDIQDACDASPNKILFYGFKANNENDNETAASLFTQAWRCI